MFHTILDFLRFFELWSILKRSSKYNRGDGGEPSPIGRYSSHLQRGELGLVLLVGLSDIFQDNGCKDFSHL